jgi:hypothetical protein
MCLKEMGGPVMLRDCNGGLAERLIGMVVTSEVICQPSHVRACN